MNATPSCPLMPANTFFSYLKLGVLDLSHQVKPTLCKSLSRVGTSSLSLATFVPKTSCQFNRPMNKICCQAKTSCFWGCGNHLYIKQSICLELCEYGSTPQLDFM